MKTYTPTPPPQSPKAYKSMVERNGITPEKIEALRESLVRGRGLIGEKKI